MIRSILAVYLSNWLNGPNDFHMREHAFTPCLNLKISTHTQDQ
jgi:hypothetical protein